MVFVSHSEFFDAVIKIHVVLKMFCIYTIYILSAVVLIPATFDTVALALGCASCP